VHVPQNPKPLVSREPKQLTTEDVVIHMGGVRRDAACTLRADGQRLGECCGELSIEDHSC
jgi:hypothetical protein